jgi:hypothetical protein
MLPDGSRRVTVSEFQAPFRFVKARSPKQHLGQCLNWEQSGWGWLKPQSLRVLLNNSDKFYRTTEVTPLRKSRTKLEGRCKLLT